MSIGAKAIKELSDEIQSLKEEIKELKEMIIPTVKLSEDEKKEINNIVSQMNRGEEFDRSNLFVDL